MHNALAPENGLTPSELFAFAALARWLVQLDGRFTKDEAAAIDQVTSDILGATTPLNTPYRQSASAAEPPDTSAIWPLLERAGAELKDENAVRLVAQGVTRQQAREIIYGALYEVAASDVISKEEWPLLDWLAKEWAIPPLNSDST